MGQKKKKVKKNLIRLQESIKLWNQSFRTACLEIAASAVTYTIFKTSHKKSVNYTYVSGLHLKSKIWTTCIKSKRLRNHAKFNPSPLQNWSSDTEMSNILMSIQAWFPNVFRPLRIWPIPYTASVPSQYRRTRGHLWGVCMANTWQKGLCNQGC